MTGISGWTLVVEVPKEAVDIFDQAFSPIAVATSSFETSDPSIWRMEAFSVDRPDEMAVVGAVALAAEIAAEQRLIAFLWAQGRRWVQGEEDTQKAG